MYVYCVYPAMSKKSENLSDLNNKDRNKRQWKGTLLSFLKGNNSDKTDNFLIKGDNVQMIYYKLHNYICFNLYIKNGVLHCIS
jgi:hypothetical protein